MLAAQTALAAQPRRVVAQVDQTNLAPNDEAANTAARLMQERSRMVAQYQPNAPMLVEWKTRSPGADPGARGAWRRRADPARGAQPGGRTAHHPPAGRAPRCRDHREPGAQVRRQKAEGEARNLRCSTSSGNCAIWNATGDTLDAGFRQFSQREAAARMSEQGSAAVRRPRAAALRAGQWPQPDAPPGGRADRRHRLRHRRGLHPDLPAPHLAAIRRGGARHRPADAGRAAGRALAGPGRNLRRADRRQRTSFSYVFT